MKMLKKVIVIIISSLALSFAAVGVHEYIQLQLLASSLKKVAASELKYPESAKFRNLELKSNLVSKRDRLTMFYAFIDRLGFKDGLAAIFEQGDISLCGEVNAKNEFGSHPGFTTFYARPGDPPAAFIDSTTSQYEFSRTYSKNHCEFQQIVLMRVGE